MYEWSGILAQKPREAQPPPAEPKPDKEPMLAPLPEKLLDVPGFIKEYTEYTMRTGQYPDRSGMNAPMTTATRTIWVKR